MVKTKIPEGWEEKTLGKLGFYINGYAFKPSDWEEFGWPIIRIEQLTDRTAKCDYYDKVLPDKYVINDGDLIFSWSATLSLVIWDRGRAFLNQHLFKVLAKNGIDQLFLKYLIEFNLDKLSGEAHGSTMKHITRPHLLNYLTNIPKLPFEQNKIAQIFQTIDNAIDKTQALIEKNEKIKQGLMHDFFEKKKGLIEDFLGNNAKITMGQSPASEDCNEEGVGIPFLQGNADFGSPYPHPKLFCISPTKLAYKGEILISVRAPVGDINLADQDYCIGRGLSSISAKGNLVQTFLYYCLIYFRFQLSRVMQGTTFEAVNSDDLFKIKIRFSEDKTEQIRIANILSSIDNKIQSEENYLKKLTQMKAGLMQVLLTGDRRVKLEAS